MAFKYTEEQLNKLDKELLVQLFLGLQDQMEGLTRQTQALNDKMQLMMEQLVLSKKSRFGRSSEKMAGPGQIRFMEVDGEIVFFNEAEAVCDLDAPEPDSLEPQQPKKKKQAGKREADLAGLPVRRIDHYLSEKELAAEFGEKGWKQLPDAISRSYRFVPAKVEVEEHHVGVYSSKTDDRMVKAPHPKKLLPGSLVSPSLAAAVLNGKYVNAVPLYRYPVIQADETPVLVNKDGRPAGSKSWMWVYRSGCLYQKEQVILYEYQKTRNASHPRKFLKDYNGICVTDGYQVYHTLEKEKEDLKIAGCWVHCRRKFEEALEVIPKELRKQSVLDLLMNQIRAIYREEGKLSGFSADERVEKRQLVVKPLVDAFFAYVKQNSGRVPKSGKAREAFTYALNQEPYLRVFLENGDVPMDNNASERAIRGFCIGKKNWEMIDTVHGASASAIIYSISETAKANGLKPYEYFEYLLTEIPKHQDESSTDFLADLLPWSEKLPEYIRKPKKASEK